MRNELQQIEEIERYLEGKMGPEARRVFEHRMKVDNNLQSQVQLQQQLTQRIQIGAFRNEIANFHIAYTEAATVRAKSYRFYFNSLFLFGVLGLAAASVYYFWPESKKDGVTEVSIGQNENTNPPAFDDNKNEFAGTPVVAEKNPNEPATAVEPVNKTYKRLNKHIPESSIPFTPLVVDQNPPCQNFLLKPQVVHLDASMGGVMELSGSKSRIHIPGGILTDQQGNPVTGMVDIKYNEYRNAAEMAYLQIPMVFSENGKNYTFNSAGMFEIRAYQNGEELKMKPGTAFEIDYNTTGAQDSAFIFTLDKKSGPWTRVEPIRYSTPETIAQQDTVTTVNQDKGQVFIRVKDVRTNENISSKVFSCFTTPAADRYRANIIVDSGYTVSSIAPGTYDIQLELDGYKKIIMTQVKVFEGRITYIDAKLAPLTKRRAQKYEGDYIVRLSGDKTVDLDKKDRNNALVKKETGIKEGDRIKGYTDAGHYFPKMIKDLKCGSFGVYNCAQIHLLNSPVQITASYKNTSGEDIRDAYLVSMIDLNYNGAFSFDPKQFTCSSNGENVLILFTRSNRVYALPADEFKAMNLTTSGRYTFTMTDITETVKNSEDLRQYLGLKK